MTIYRRNLDGGEAAGSYSKLRAQFISKMLYGTYMQSQYGQEIFAVSEQSGLANGPFVCNGCTGSFLVVKC